MSDHIALLPNQILTKLHETLVPTSYNNYLGSEITQKRWVDPMPHDIRASAPRVFVVSVWTHLQHRTRLRFWVCTFLVRQLSLAWCIRINNEYYVSRGPFPCSFAQVTHRPMQQGDSFPIHWEIAVTPPHGTWGEWTFHHTRFLNYATALVTNCTSAWTWELVNPLSLPVEAGALFTFSQSLCKVL